MSATMKCLVVFAATVSAIAVGNMLGNQYADNQCQFADFRAHVERDREEIQRFRRSQDLEIQQRQAEREAKLRAFEQRAASSTGR